jgi:hypothetical protein
MRNAVFATLSLIKFVIYKFTGNTATSDAFRPATAREIRSFAVQATFSYDTCVAKLSEARRRLRLASINTCFSNCQGPADG